MNIRTMVRLLATLSLVLVLMGSVGAQGEPTFRIGILDSPEGPLAAGAQLAINQINAAGGLRGADGQQYRLDAVVQGPDIQGSLGTAIGNLTNAGVAAVVGPTTGDQVRNHLVALQNMNVPVLTAAVDDTLLANESTDRLFRARSAEQLQGQALANIMIRDFAITDLQTILLDPSGTAGQVGFALAVRQLGAQLGTAIIFDPANETIDNLVRRVMQRTPQALVLYGAPDVANQFYLGLRSAQYGGIVAYGGAEDAEFRAGLTPSLLDGIVAPLTWSYALQDEASERFVLDFARATGRVPNALAAAGYDAVLLIAAGLQRPQALQDSILATNVVGAQGPLSPARLPLGETSDSVVVVQFLGTGGAQVLARFENGIRIAEAGDARPPVVIATPTPRPTNTPTFTPTLDGVYATVVSQALNVRTGPSTIYDVLGQLRNGEQVRLIGANVDFSWGVLSFRGQQGWISLAPNLASVVGDLRTLPVIAAPPTPTPGPTSTPAPTATPSQPDVIVLSAVPAVLTWGTINNVSVTVQNAGAGQTGQVAFAASFEPGAVFSGVTIPAPGLFSGQSQVVNLPVTLSGSTGFYSTVIVADLNNEVNEGPGEANNGSFIFNYKLDHATASAGSITLNSGVGINLDGLGGDDLFFSGGTMSAPGVCSPNTASCIGALTVGLDFNSAHYDAITAANGVSLNALGLAFGQTVGFITDGGKRGVMRVDAVGAGSVTFSYRVYM